MERVGLVGLGRMGTAMAGRLLADGAALTVHNRTPERAADLLARGAAWADSPAALTATADMILTSLTDDRAVEEVFVGPRGLLAGDVAGRLFVEMSTIRPATIHALRPRVEAGGARLLDAPVSGTLQPAREGQLIALIGGEPADLERARPLLERLCRRIVHLGPSGSGATMKLVLNMPMAVYWAGLAEALAIGRHAGLDLDLMLETIVDSSAALVALRPKLPILAGAPHEVAFDVTGVRKDLLAMVGAAAEAGVPAPAGAAALAHFAAATAAGYGQRDLIFMLEYFLEAARTSAGRPPPERPEA